MKNCLMVAGGIFLVLVLIGACAIGYVAYVGNKLDASSKTYVDECIPAIVSNWSKDELLKRASPQFHQAVAEDQVDLLFKKLSSLGQMKNYEGAKGDSNINYTTTNGKVITAYYVGKATFENGKAEIRIKLIQTDGMWQILNFYVDSPIFLK